MSQYVHREMFPLGEDSAPYRLLTTDYVSQDEFDGREVLKVDTRALTLMAAVAMRDTSHLLRPGHLEQLARILDDPEASDNDRFVALELLKNANIAGGGVLPMCQDTGTAIVLGKKGQNVWTNGDDEAALSEGILKAFLDNNLRYSQMAPLDMFEEINTGSNLPAQIDLFAGPGDSYKLMFVAKGGGSANKTFLYQETKALLNPERLMEFLDEKLRSLGTAACPPYHLAIVIGGTSAELTLKTVKLASTHFLDTLPRKGNEYGQAFRDTETEEAVFKMCQGLGIGAQFGGKFFCHDVRVIRLPRHGASLPVGIGVSCSADRQILGKITADGVFLEELEQNPARFLPDVTDTQLGGEVIQIDLGQPMADILKTLGAHPIRTRLSLTGPMIVARDIAPRQAQGTPRRGPGPARIHPRSLCLLRGPGQDAEGHGIGLLRPDHGGTHGFLCGPISGGRRLHGHAGQGQPLPGRDPGVQGTRRVLSRLHRRPGGQAGPGLHPQGGVHRV